MFRVGHRDIAVLGDVAAWPYQGSGELVRVKLWTNAAEMAMTAAAGLLAGDAALA